MSSSDSLWLPLEILDDESLKAYLAPTGLVSEPRGDLTFRGDRGLVSEPRGDLTCRGDLRLEVPKTGLKQHKFYSVNNTYPPPQIDLQL